MYDEISETLHQEGRGQVNAIVIRGFRNIMGEGFTNKVVEPLDAVEEMKEARCSSSSAGNMIL